MNDASGDDGGNGDGIPVLSDAVDLSAAGAPLRDLDRLQTELCASSLNLCEHRLRKACREAEQLLTDRVMSAMRAELPAIVSRVLQAHFDREA